jgi:hypothetical protein
MGGQAAGALPAAEGSLNVMKRARSLRVSVPVFFVRATLALKKRIILLKHSEPNKRTVFDHVNKT